MRPEPPAFAPTGDLVRRVAAGHGTPAYLYDEPTLRARAEAVAAFGGPFGFTGRYAVKANPSAAVIRLFDEVGLHFDASTVFEARRVIAAGVDPARIQVTAQNLADDFVELCRAGALVTACSLDQLDRFGRAFPGGSVGVRLNPGQGSGHNNRTNVAGPNASFGIWHEHLDAILRVAAAHDLRIVHAHHHVGSGGDPAKWASIAGVTIDLLDRLPEVTTVNLGGGFKVARVPGDVAADLTQAAEHAHALVRGFAERTGRKLHLEIEPGTWLTATAGVLVGQVIDVVDTGAEGRLFVKLDVGMAELLRPSMYGAQHPIAFVPAAGRELAEPRELIVVGPCCESGDILTPARGDAEELGPRTLPVPARGDLAVIGGTGAYCAGMAARNYNSIPASPELLRLPDDSVRVLRRRQTLEDVLREEV